MPTTVANPGDVVVPLSTIIDQLQGRLSSAEIDALLLAVLGGRRQQVNPGDLITADLVNQILRDIADLNLRMAQLESGSTTTPVLQLFQPVDGAQFRAGEDLVIQGRNLGFTQGTSVVTIDGIRATDYRTGSTDDRITVRIPGVSTPTADGRDVVLVVSNGTSSAIRTLRIRPAQDLAGAMDVTWEDVTPNPIQPGQRATFEFRLKSRANLDASYLVTPVISQVASAETWTAAATVLLQGAAVPSRLVPVAAGAERTIQIRIDPVPAVANGTTFSLSVAAVSGAVTGTTGRLRMSVGTAITLPDPDVTVSLSTAEFFPADSGTLSRGTEFDSVQVDRTATARLTLVANITTPGEYLARIEPIASPGTPSTGWTMVRHPQDPADPADAGSTYSYFNITEAQIAGAGSEGVPISPRFHVTPASGASTLAEAELKVERRNSGMSRSRLISLSAT
jgi:hypothetical protein